MTPSEINGWAAAGESETLELKRTTGERRQAARTLCAMLNHRGGRVLFGVESDGRVIGQHIGNQTLEEVAQEVGEIDPPVYPSIERVPVGADREVLVVSVSTGPNRPYSYKGQGYRRVGNTNQALSRDEYDRMLLERVHGQQRWENQPAAGWSVADLDDVPPQRVRRDVTERQREILALLAQTGTGVPLREILDQLGSKAIERQVREDLATLRTLGLAHPEGHGRGARWKRL